MHNGEQSYGGFNRRTKGKGGPRLMSAYYEIAALLLQLENPWLRCPNSRSFFSSYNKQTEDRELLKLIQPINEIRAPDHFSISLILVPSPAFLHSEMSVLSITSSHDPLPSLETKGSVSPPVTLLSRNSIVLRTPLPAVSPHISLAIAASHAHPIPRIASTFLRSRDIFLIPKEKSEFC